MRFNQSFLVLCDNMIKIGFSFKLVSFLFVGDTKMIYICVSVFQ